MKILTALFSICFLLCAGNICAQDAFHTGLQAKLSSEYGLPTGEWILANTEAQLISRTFRFGVSVSDQAIANQNFSREISVRTTRASPNFYEAGYGVPNATTVRKGDVVLFVFSVRSSQGAGQVSVAIERTSDYAKEFSVNLPVDINWQTYYIAFQSAYGDHAPGKLNFIFQVGHQAQDIRLGGIAALNFGKTVPLSALPSDLNADKYDGYEADAAWRAPAAQRIETLRKADLRLVAKTSSGAAVANVPFHVEQLQHEFAFGTAIKACRIANNNCFNPIYQTRLTNLDGRGHGFNWVVFENDLKWPAWEEKWFVPNADVAKATQWLRDRDIKVRGHNLLWPGFDNLPNDVKARAADTAFVLGRIRNHVNLLANYPGLAGELADWDVINETVTNFTLENAFRGQAGYPTGRELYAKVFEIARAANPEVKLYLNDYITISSGNGPTSAPYRALHRNLQELIDAGAPVDGLGFQGHIGAQPNGIPSVLAVYDDFYNKYGLEAKVTEFDLPPSVSDTLAAKYFGDFLTATFSHPSMTGLMMWNWWDTDTWLNPQANLFDASWNLTPSGKTFVDKVFKEWWTDADVVTTADGVASLRGFKGKYVVSYACGGVVRRDTLTLAEAMTHDIVCDAFTSGTSAPIAPRRVRLSPNPSSGAFRLEHDFQSAQAVEVTSVSGQVLWRGVAVSGTTEIDVVLPKGMYNVRVGDDSESVTQQLIVQ